MTFKKCLAVLLALTFMLSMLPVPALAEYDMPYYIEVDLTNQIVTIYNTRDSSIARQMLCSAGIGNKTPTGEWFMPRKERDDERTEWYWMPNAYTWVKYATKFYYAYFFHSIPYNDNMEGAISESALSQFGNPASHGCIRLLEEDAYFIATECLAGTYVKIYRSGVKNENLRALLYDQGTYIQGIDKTYSEFLGISVGDLGQGSAGSEVIDLQYRLSDLGYYSGEATGSYDSDTLAAVVKVQKDLGLLPTGICTAALKEIIFSDNAPVITGKNTVTEGQSGPVVEKLQLALQELGVYQGPIDTIYDAEVSQAVSDFQRLCGITQDGVASPEVQHAIYYVLNKLHTELGGSDFTVERVMEDVVYGTLNASANINVREKPDTDSDRIGKVVIGERILVLQVEGQWAKIVCDGKIGYIYKKYLSNPETEQLFTLKYTSAGGASCTLGTSIQGDGSSSKALLKEIQSSYSSGKAMDYLHETPIEYATVNTGDDSMKLNLRADAASDADVLDKAVNATRMRVLNRDEEWTQAVYNGQIVYLMSAYLEFSTGSMDDEDEAVSTQHSLTDAPAAKATVVSGENAVGAQIRVASSENSSIFMHAPDGLEVKLLSYSAETGWALINYEDYYGFIKIENLSF